MGVGSGGTGARVRGGVVDQVVVSAVARVIRNHELASDARAAIDNQRADQIHGSVDWLLLAKRNDVQDHGLGRIVDAKLEGVFVENLGLVIGNETTRLHHDEVHRILRRTTVQPHPQEREVIRHVEQFGTLILGETNDALWQDDLVGERGAKIDGSDVRNDFHVDGNAEII